MSGRSLRTPVRVVHLITGLNVGGAELMLARLVRRLDPDRVSSTVVSLIPGGHVATELRRAGIDVRSLSLTRRVPDPRGVLRLRKLLAAVRPAVLHTWLYHADLLGTIARARGGPALVWNLRASNMDMRRYRWLSGLTRWACVRLSRVPDAIVANSRAGRAFHERLGYRNDRWRVIPNGIDTKVFAPDPQARREIRVELGLDGEDRTRLVGLIARVDPMKGHDTFLAAAARVIQVDPSVRFVLAGEGVSPSADPFAAWLRADPQLASRVHLLGRRDDVPRLMAALDLCCSASVFGEGFPNVVAEAMASEVPVVATDVGDAARLVGDTGRVVPAGNVDALAAALLAALAWPEEARRTAGRDARVRIEREYALDVVVSDYEALFHDLAARTMPS